MKLSEAILAGSRLHPQAFGTARDVHGNTCALMAAADAMNIRTTEQLRRKFPELSLKLDSLDLPEAISHCHTSYLLGLKPPYTISLQMAVQILNDSCRWPRELIARWVAYLERK